MEEDYDFNLNLCVIGGHKVGKTQIVERYTRDTFGEYAGFYGIFI